MDSLLIISQIVFYSVCSLVMIALGVLGITAVVYLIRLTKELQGILKNVHEATDDFRERAEEIMKRLANFPLLSYFLKDPDQRSNKKSRIKEE